MRGYHIELWIFLNLNRTVALFDFELSQNMNKCRLQQIEYKRMSSLKLIEYSYPNYVLLAKFDIKLQFLAILNLIWCQIRSWTIKNEQKVSKQLLTNQHKLISTINLN